MKYEFKGQIPVKTMNKIIENWYKFCHTSNQVIVYKKHLTKKCQKKRIFKKSRKSSKIILKVFLKYPQNIPKVAQK